MKRRPSLLKRIWRKLVSPKPAPAVKTRVPARPVGSSLESLEGRISPAALINPTTLLYKDLDGDIVTVKFTKSLFTSATAVTNLANANSVFQFSDGTNPIANAVTGTVFNAATAPAEQLLLVDLTKAPTSGATKLASGTGLSITAVKTGAGNGFVDVGYINATGLPLGAVTVSGDLGQIDAGFLTAATGLASLKTKTLGVRDPATTQPVTGRSLVSNIVGSLGSLTVTGDVATASVLVTNSAAANGTIGFITIGGSLKGAAGAGTGLISAAADIGLVKIGTLPADGIVGGGSTNAGSIQAGGKIAGLTVSGGILGAAGTGSGSVHAGGTLGTVKVAGSLTGKAGKDSGSITAAGIGAVTIGGSIVGGGDAGSGVVSSTKTIGAVKVVGNLDGTSAGVASSGVGEGGIFATGNIASVTIVGDIKGGPQAASGFITTSADLGAVNVHSIVGAGGQSSGVIYAGGKIASLTVNGSITGLTGSTSGSVHATGTLGAVNVKGSLTGGAGTDSGSITGAGIGGVTFGGSILGGGSNLGSGVVASTKTIGAVRVAGSIDGTNGVAGIRAVGNIGPVTIIGNLKGGALPSSGFIDSGGDLGAVTVNAITGGGGQDSGTITVAGKLSTATLTGLLGLTVKGDVTGGAGAGSGSVFSGTDSTHIGDLGPVKIGGKLVGNTGDSSGTISSGGKIAGVTIGPAVPPVIQPDSLMGGSGGLSGAVVSHGTMGAVKITGNILGGGGAFSGVVWSQDLITASSESAGDLGTVTVTGHVQGGVGTDSGEIRADGKLASATTGSILGAGGARSGSIRAGQGSIHVGTGAITIKGDLTGAGGASETGGVIAEGKIASVLVTGAVTGGAIRAGDDLGSITVNHDVTGGSQFSARGQAIHGLTTDLAIGHITILGNIANTRIRAGYDSSLTNPVNPDAQIGAVYVKGSWTASSLFAGVMDGGDNQFGNANDVKISGADSPKIVSQIASIVVGGTVAGTAGGGDHFGFVAQRIGAMKVGAVVEHFTTALDIIELTAGTTGDVTAREVAL